MASKGAIAARHAVVRERLNKAMARLSHKEDVPLPPPLAVPYRQPELKAAAELERVADFLEALAGDAPAPPDPEPDTPQQGEGEGDGGGEPDGGTDAGDRGDEPEPDGEDGEPRFAGHPLSFYDGKSDDEIREVKGVGPKVFERIKEAQSERG